MNPLLLIAAGALAGTAHAKSKASPAPSGAVSPALYVGEMVSDVYGSVFLAPLGVFHITALAPDPLDASTFQFGCYMLRKMEEARGWNPGTPGVGGLVSYDYQLIGDSQSYILPPRNPAVHFMYEKPAAVVSGYEPPIGPPEAPEPLASSPHAYLTGHGLGSIYSFRAANMGLEPVELRLGTLGGLTWPVQPVRTHDYGVVRLTPTMPLAVERTDGLPFQYYDPEVNLAPGTPL